jgi:hypothetical protein
MSVKTVFALVSALAVTTSTAALAQYVGPRPYKQHPEYRPASVDRGYGGEPQSFGAGDMPRSFRNEEQQRYSQSPPNGAE